MKNRKAIAAYVAGNADELFEILARFSRRERQSIGFDGQILRIDLIEETLSDKSTVLDISIRESTKAEIRREKE